MYSLGIFGTGGVSFILERGWEIVLAGEVPRDRDCETRRVGDVGLAGVVVVGTMDTRRVGEVGRAGLVLVGIIDTRLVGDGARGGAAGVGNADNRREGIGIFGFTGDVVCGAAIAEPGRG